MVVSRTAPTLLLTTLTLLAFVGDVKASNSISLIGSAAAPSFSDGGRSIFYAQSRYWACHFEGYGQDIGCSSSPPGVTWPTTCKIMPGDRYPSCIGGGGYIGLGCFNAPLFTPYCLDWDQWVMANDNTHVYFAFSGPDGIWFAFALLNPNGTATFDTVGGIPPNTSGGSPPGGYPLKHVSDEGKGRYGYPPITRLSVTVARDGHAFIAYSGPSCGLCVFDSSAPPYTSWTNSLRVTDAFNSPIIFPYLQGQIMVVAGNYANIWNGGWGIPSSLSGNDGVRDSYAFVAHGTVYLFEAMSCQQTPGSECVGMFSFSGGEWSLERATNVPLHSNFTPVTFPFQVTYDGSKDRFLIFASDPTNTVLYEYSAQPHATHYGRTTTAAGRVFWTSFVSSETTIVNAKMHVDNIAVTWFEPNPACSGVNDACPALMYAYVGPTP